MNRDFKGVWIPKEIWTDENLTWMEKLFLTEIDSLDNEQGCFASNKYFSNFFKLTTQRCSQVINRLVEKRYISTEIERDGERIVKRTLRVVNKFDRGYQESFLGYQEKVKDNNTSNNTIPSEQEAQAEKQKAERKKLRELYCLRYAEKALEIKGSNITADGSIIKPTWGAKENNLLLGDWKSNAYADLERYIELFFSDRVKEVKEFCRTKEKAGYAYSVFHGMIEKLKLSNVKLPSKCPQCGSIEGHLSTCPISIAKAEAKQKEIDEIMKDKESAGELNLMAQVKKKVQIAS